jgi:hypothetical protein
MSTDDHDDNSAGLRLKREVESYLRGEAPPPAELARAPRLQGWRAVIVRARGDDPPARAMAKLRSRRVRNPAMGGLVQQPKAPGAHRPHTAGRSRGALLRHAGTTGHGGITQTKRPPANPARFNVPFRCSRASAFATLCEMTEFPPINAQSAVKNRDLYACRKKILSFFSAARFSSIRAPQKPFPD